MQNNIQKKNIVFICGNLPEKESAIFLNDDAPYQIHNKNNP